MISLYMLTHIIRYSMSSQNPILQTYLMLCNKRLSYVIKAALTAHAYRTLGPDKYTGGGGSPLPPMPPHLPELFTGGGGGI
jgi:hypothetical protein